MPEALDVAAQRLCRGSLPFGYDCAHILSKLWRALEGYRITLDFSNAFPRIASASQPQRIFS
jgi:hypothetical protein